MLVEGCHDPLVGSWVGECSAVYAGEGWMNCEGGMGIFMLERWLERDVDVVRPSSDEVDIVIV
jgi:hypothetical protein